MTWINLSSPALRQHSEQYTPFIWPAGRLRSLALNEASGQLATQNTVLTIIGQRRSRREFVSLPLATLAQLLWHSEHTQATSPSELGFELEQRPTPSGGAIHPLHILIKTPDDDGWCRYDSRAHALVDIDGASETLSALCLQADGVLSAPTATKVLWVAEPGKTASKYHDPESIIWRDAGASVAVMALIAEALGMNFCPLGITGEPWASQLAPHGILTGVGMALMGGRP